MSMMSYRRVELTLRRDGPRSVGVTHASGTGLVLVCSLDAGLAADGPGQLRAVVTASRTPAADEALAAGVPVAVVEGEVGPWEIVFPGSALGLLDGSVERRELWMVVYGVWGEGEPVALGYVRLTLTFDNLVDAEPAGALPVLAVDKGGRAWVSGRPYEVDTVVARGGVVYVATGAHTASAATAPGTGVSWGTVWQVQAGGAGGGATDAQLRDRSTHTGTQVAGTISDFAAAARAQVAGMLAAGAGVSLAQSGSGAGLVVTVGLVRDPVRIPAGALISAITGGAGVDFREDGGYNRDFLAFGPGVNLLADCNELLWPAGAVGLRLRYEWQTSGTGGVCVWGGAARVWGDGDAAGSALGAEQVVGDGAQGAQVVLLSEWSGVVTPAGVLAAGAPLGIKVGRRGLSTSPADNLGAVALLAAVHVQFV